MSQFEKIASSIAAVCLFLMFSGMAMAWPTWLIPVFLAPLFAVGLVWIWKIL